jgi:sugar transferase (PEP-CTERM/EpsH1 system associated)
MNDTRPLVLHVIHHLRMGGMENGLVNLINHLPAERFRHAIACVEDYSDFRNRLETRNTKVYALHRSRIGVWNLRKALFDLCRTLRPAIVHSRNLSGLDAIPPARLAGVRACIHGEHGWDVSDLHGTHWKPRLLRRLHAPLVSRFVTVSKDLEQYLIRKVGVAGERIQQIYNGVDTARFRPATEKPYHLLPADFIQPDAFVIGTVGRIQPVKDQATLLRAFARLMEINPELKQRARLAVVGDGPLLDELRRLADSLGIQAQTWLPGALNNIPEVLQCFDVFVLPSLAEGISNTILEAMASGLPVIATAVGGNRELVDQGHFGSLLTPGDVQALTEHLAAYVMAPDRLRTHSQAARAVTLERYSLTAMVTQYGQLYEHYGFPAAETSIA